MALEAISDRAEIQSLLAALSGRLARQGFSLSTSANNDWLRPPGQLLSEYDFNLSLGIRGNWLGLSLLDEQSEPVRALEMVVFSPNTGAGETAGILARDPDGRVWLLHNGRVHHERDSSPWSTETALVKQKEYYVVSSLDDDHFFSNIVDYHLSRFDLSARHQATSTDHWGTDPGPSVKHKRYGAHVTPRHSPIVKALHAIIPGEFKPKRVRYIWPDILVDDGRGAVLFEIKSDALLSSLMTAIGQMDIYARCCSPRAKILVCPPLSEGRIYDALTSSFSERGIAVVNFIEHERGFDFPNLLQALR